MRLLALSLVAIALPFSGAQAQGLVEISQDIGIDHVYEDRLWIGGGTALFDYDGDGDLDIYLTGGQRRDALYRNDGGWQFTDVSFEVGLGSTDAVVTMGVAVGDIDNDGDPDLFITTRRGDGNMLLLNDDGLFLNVAETAGFPNDLVYSASATFGDIDLDGDLDLYETTYIQEPDFLVDADGAVVGYAHGCFTDRLWINDGSGAFSERAAALGIVENGCGLAATFSDADADGYPDLFVVNDFGAWVEPNALLRNVPTVGRFQDISQAAGADTEIYGMSIAPGDYDRDGDLDYYMSNLGANVLLQQGDPTRFSDQATAAGVLNTTTASGLLSASWGTAFADLDHDGWLDLLLGNGWVPAAPFVGNDQRAPDRAYRNRGDGTFEDASTTWGFDSPFISRGLATGDLDGDGDLDVVVTTAERGDGQGTGEYARVYRNDAADGAWIAVDPVGTRSNRDGIGARVEVFADDTRWIAEASGGSGYASHSAGPVHIGLGDVTLVDSLVVTWPGGGRDVMRDLAVDQTVRVVETGPTPVEGGPSPTALRAEPNRPNPFQTATTIAYSAPSPVTLRIYDTLGRLVALASGPAGDGHVRWDGRDAAGRRAAAGVYVYTLTSDAASVTGTLTLLP